MRYELKAVENKTDEPKIEVYSSYQDFDDTAPKDSKYLTHVGGIKPRKFINQNNFLEVAKEIPDRSTDAQEFHSAQTLHKTPDNSDLNSVYHLRLILTPLPRCCQTQSQIRFKAAPAKLPRHGAQF